MGHPFADAPGLVRSLNGARIASLPDDLAGEDILGRRGIELVSGLRLRRDIDASSTELQLDPQSPELLREFALCLTGPMRSPSARLRARAIAAGFGYRLGCLLLMLSCGEPANRAIRPAWGDEHWRFWAGVRRVVIGGGLLAGTIGDVAVPVAQDILDAHGAGHVRLSRSPWGDSIGLVGLARVSPLPSEQRAVFDFGQTSVKGGLATYRHGRLIELRLLPAMPCPCSSPVGLSTDRPEIEAQWDGMLNLIAATVRTADRDRGRVGDVQVAVASYLRDGQPDPIEIEACYGRLQVLGPDLAALGRRGLADRLGFDIGMKFWEDGAAAGLAEDPDEASVVLTIGTAMGIGFALARDQRLPLDAGFHID
jgi:hypothetical protein